jgi:hypothetical protein
VKAKDRWHKISTIKYQGLETHITRFKSADQEYDKIKMTIEEVITVPIYGKVHLQFALAP